MRNQTILFTAALSTLLTGATQAQMSSTAQLKAACEAAPGNVLAINADVLIDQGAQWPAVETINSGCTLVIGNNAKFGVKQVGLAFSGAFNVQSAFKTEFLVQEASIAAALMAWSLPALDNVIVLDQAQIATTAGDFAATLGAVGKFETLGMLSGATNAIQAFGTLSVAGGRQFQGIFQATSVQAGTGVTVSVAGTQPLVSFLQTDVRSSAGSINVSSSGAQGVFEATEGLLSAPAINITMGGAESQVKASLVTFNAGNGSIAIVSGTGANPLGLVEITQSNLISSSNISLFGSRNGAGGTCRNTSNTITGPGQRLCR